MISHSFQDLVTLGKDSIVVFPGLIPATATNIANEVLQKMKRETKSAKHLLY